MHVVAHKNMLDPHLDAILYSFHFTIHLFFIMLYCCTWTECRICIRRCSFAIGSSWRMTVRVGISKFRQLCGTPWRWRCRRRCPVAKSLLWLLQRITMMKWDRLAKYSRATLIVCYFFSSFFSFRFIVVARVHHIKHWKRARWDSEWLRTTKLLWPATISGATAIDCRHTQDTKTWTQRQSPTPPTIHKQTPKQ